MAEAILLLVIGIFSITGLIVFIMDLMDNEML